MRKHNVKICDQSPNRHNYLLTARICVTSLTFVSKSHCACTLRLHCCEPATSSCCNSCRMLLLDNVSGPCCGDGDDGCSNGSDRAVANRPEVSKFCRGSSAAVNFRPPRWNCCCCRCWKTPSKPIGVCCCCSCSCCRCCTEYLLTDRVLGITGDDHRRKTTWPLFPVRTPTPPLAVYSKSPEDVCVFSRLHGFAVEIDRNLSE